MTKEELILQLFRTTHILGKFLQLQESIKTDNILGIDRMEIPDDIIANVKRRHAESLKQLKDAGIDGEAYLNSAKGQIAYMTYSIDREQTEALHDRCQRCLKFVLKHEKNGMSTDEQCEIYKEQPMNCKQFEDTKIDFYDRLVLSIDRCSECDHYKTINDGLIHEICMIGCNEIKPTCPSFKNKSWLLPH